jgi:Rod binding domain-containing protein
MTLTATNTDFQDTAGRQQAKAVGGLETPAHKKLVKAAQEFEGILISQILGDFQKGLSSLDGDSSTSAPDTLNSLAIQTLSEALARNGGLGVGSMIVHQLDPRLHRGTLDQQGGKIKTASRD